MFDGKFSTANSKPTNSLKLNKRVVPIILIALVLIILATSLFYEVPAGNIGVVLRFSAVDRVSFPGINIKLPFVERVVLMNVRTQKDEVQATAMSENLQVVTSLIAVNYHLDGSRAKDVFENVGADYANIIVAPAIQNTFKAVTAQFSAEELITKRDEVRFFG